jgi:hypothetical protein
MCWSFAVEKMISPSLLYLEEYQYEAAGAVLDLCALDLSQCSLLCGPLAGFGLRYVLAALTCPCSNIGLMFATQDNEISRREWRGVFLLKSSRRLPLASIKMCVEESGQSEASARTVLGRTSHPRRKKCLNLAIVDGNCTRVHLDLPDEFSSHIIIMGPGPFASFWISLSRTAKGVI